MTVTQATFLLDVKRHAMTVHHDDGVYRHLSFCQPDHRWLYRFDIVTWPGALCIRGDVGTYAFSRLHDMFEFFRSPMTTAERIDINEDYWAEKLIASDCSGRRGSGAMRFDPDLFSAEVKRRYVEHIRSRMREEPDKRRKLRLALEDDVLAYAEAGEAEAMRAACEFEHDGFVLRDFWEAHVHGYTSQFVWSLYAIAWAIWTYDNRPSTRGMSPAAPEPTQAAL
jgi:hypothetical protein